MTEEKRGRSGEPKSVASLLPWHRTARAAERRRHLNELLASPDADEKIRSLTELEVYYAVKEAGSEEATPVLGLLEPRQIQALFDLDTWRGDRIDLAEFTAWLRIFQEAGRNALVKAARAIDSEALALFLRRRLFIAMKPGEASEPSDPPPAWLLDPPEEILPIIETPDDRFVIAARAEEDDPDEGHSEIEPEDRETVLTLLDALYRAGESEFVATVLLQALQNMGSALEETAYEFRNVRLEELGFPPVERAIEVYSPLDPASLTRGAAALASEPPTELRLPALHVTQLSEGLFAKAMEAIDDPALVRRIESELVALVNAIVMADGVDLGDLERVRKSLIRARCTIELALAHATPAESLVETARLRLASRPVWDLFRMGHTLTLGLGHRARRIERSGAFAEGTDRLALLSEVDRAVVGALLKKRPEFARALEDERIVLESRHFVDSQDLAKAAAALGDLESLARAVEALGLREANRKLEGALVPSTPGERSADMLIATEAAQAALGHGLVLEPLDRAGLALFRQSWGPEAQAAARAAAEAAVATEDAPAVVKRAEAGLSALAGALLSLPPEAEIDPRFVGIVVCRLD